MGLPARALHEHDHGPRDLGGEGRAVVLLDQREREVDAGADAGRGDDGAVPHVQGVGLHGDTRIALGEQRGLAPVGRRLAAVQQPDLGKQELAAAFARSNGDDWPRPIADFDLGRIDQARLLKLAAENERLARQRTCSATSYMIELYRARGEQQQADTAHESLRAQCAAPTGDAKL